jgi:hypothetical protein
VYVVHLSLKKVRDFFLRPVKLSLATKIVKDEGKNPVMLCV